LKVLLLLFLLWQTADTSLTPAVDPRYFRYERIVSVSPSTEAGDAQACVALDSAVYAHAAQSLKDVRVYEGSREVPYAITVSESLEPESEPAKVLNLGMRGSKIVFDLEMPDRPYTDVILDLEAHDFLASADVSGSAREGGASTHLGAFTLFDLSAQHLSRSTTLHLQESSFAMLHVELNLSAAPGASSLQVTPAIVKGAMVPPSREAQTLYTTVAEATAVTQRGTQSIATFHLPAHVPVESVAFEIAPDFTGNFSRDVTITDRLGDDPHAAAEILHGTIMRVRMNKVGREIKQEQRSVAATLGANLQHDAIVEVHVDNGSDKPLPLTAVKLEMRRRKLCFNAPLAAHEVTLFYGDAALDGPSYDYARLFVAADKVVTASLSEERKNPVYASRPDPLRPLTERHPELLWIVLLAVVCVLAVIALHSAKRAHK
jgi:hypothetical protein